MKNLFFFVLLFSASVSEAQVRFSVGGAIGSVFEYTNTVSREVTAVSYAPLMDSMVERRFGKNLITQSYTFTPKLEYSIFGGIDFRLSQRLEVSTGLGFSLFYFGIDRSFNQKELESMVLDTIPSDKISNRFFDSSCDSIVSTQSGGVFINRDLGLLDLQIPISLKYELFDGFKVDLGARLSTPIYTSQNGFKYESSKRVENGKIICTSSTNGYTDHSGDGFRQMRLSVIGGMHYKILENLEVNILAAKSMQSVLVNQGQYNQARVFKPVQIRLGASLFFGGQPTEKK